MQTSRLDGDGHTVVACADGASGAEEASRLGRVVSNVLGYPQLERGTLQAATSRHDLVPLLAQILERVQPAIERAGATLEVRTPASVWARWDADAVVRIVENLLDNAEKYGRGSAERVIVVEVTATTSAVELAVADLGPGLGEAMRRRLFEPFVRGDAAGGPSGLGLGLSLSKSLADAMGARLGAAAVARGTRMVLTLPAA